MINDSFIDNLMIEEEERKEELMMEKGSPAIHDAERVCW
jgi:hypothetical protein